jgi:hypothetical protein
MYFNYQNLSTGWCLTYLLWLSKSNEISYKIKNWIQRAGTISQKKKKKNSKTNKNCGWN